MANALKRRLGRRATTTVWSKGIFKPSKTNIESICQALDEFDYAAFVFAPDDVVNKRERILDAPRDNVVFEMGLFLGKLGRERVFFVVPRGTKLHLPTDLDGVVPVEYDPAGQTSNVDAAVAGASAVISQAIGESWKVWDVEVVEKTDACRERLKQLLIPEIDRAPQRHTYPSLAELQAMPAYDILVIHRKAVVRDYWWWQPKLPDLMLMEVELEMCNEPTTSRVESVRAKLEEVDMALRTYEALANPTSSIGVLTKVLGQESADMWFERRGLLDRCRTILVNGVESLPERTQYPQRDDLKRMRIGDVISILRVASPAAHLMSTYESIYTQAQLVGGTEVSRSMARWTTQEHVMRIARLRETLNEFDVCYLVK